MAVSSSFFLQVIIVVSDIVYQRVSSEFQNPGCGLVDEITVMGNVEDGSRRSWFRALSRISLEVMSRWLVGSSRMRKLASESISFARETRPRSPPLRVLDPFEHIVAGEKKGCQDVSDLGVVHVRIGVGDLLKQGFLHMKNVVLLIVIADMHLGAQA